MGGGQRIRPLHGQLVHNIIVGRGGVRVAPGQEDELAVAVHRVVEDDLLLVRRDEVTHVHVLRLDKFIYGIFCSRRRTQNGIYII